MGEPKRIVEARHGAPLYEEDYAAWLEAQVALMRADRWSEIDKDNLLDEVESLGRSEFNAFVSAIRVVLMHMLKWDFQEDYRSRSWANSITGHRHRIEKALGDNPSYRARIDEASHEAYQRALLEAADETRYPVRLFPQQLPYSWEEIMTRPHEVPGKPFDGWKP